MVLCFALLSSLLFPPHFQALSEAPSGYKRSLNHNDMELLYRENLYQDFEPYRSVKYDHKDLFGMIRTLMQGRPPKHLTILIVKGNKIHVIPMAKIQPSLTSNRVKHLISGLNNATQGGLTIQDTLLVLNTWDEPRCGSSSKTGGSSMKSGGSSMKSGGSSMKSGGSSMKSGVSCRVPLFSIIKQWDWTQGRGLQDDVLIPFFNHVYGDIISVPWKEKNSKALMRAAAQNGMDINCTRLWLLELAKTLPGSELLDVGITNNLKHGLKVPLANFIDIPSHAKWKYLISSDGFTASARLGKLLQTNSVVLKEESKWIEYYYRSIQIDKHVFSFNRNNILQVLQGLGKKQDIDLQNVTTAAQGFGYTFLSTFSKALYFSKAVELYNANFQGIPELISSFQEKDLASLDRAIECIKMNGCP